MALDELGVIKFQCNDGVLHYRASMFTLENCPYVHTLIHGKFQDCGHREIFLDEPVDVVRILFKYIKGEFNVSSYYGDLRPVVKTASTFLMLEFLQDVISNGILSIKVKDTLVDEFKLKRTYRLLCIYDRICNVCTTKLPHDVINIAPNRTGDTCNMYNKYSSHKPCTYLNSLNLDVCSILEKCIDNIAIQHRYVDAHIWSALLAYHSAPDVVLLYIQNFIVERLQSSNSTPIYLIRY